LRINTGKIGGQEAAAMVGMAIYTGTVFTMDSVLAYSKGNSSYIWLPLSILLSLGAALFIMHAMEKADVATLYELLKNSFSSVPASVAAIGTILYMAVGAYFIVADFVNMIHSFVFYDSGYWEIAVWIMLTVFFIGAMGFESIGRTALLFAPILIVVILITIIVPASGFRLHRLFPIPGNTVIDMARLTLRSANGSFWAMMGMLTVADGMHGIRLVRKAMITGTAIAAVLVMLTQLAIGMTYSYIDLSDMFFPMYRLDMMMIKEGYFFRMDKLLLFFWLIAALVSAAYYIYIASALWCSCLGPQNTIPAVTAFSAVIACGVLIQAEGYYEEFVRAFHWGGEWGWVFMLPVIGAAVIQFMKSKRKEAAKA